MLVPAWILHHGASAVCPPLYPVLTQGALHALAGSELGQSTLTVQAKDTAGLGNALEVYSPNTTQ
jgi:hypothetical protein